MLIFDNEISFILFRPRQMLEKHIQCDKKKLLNKNYLHSNTKEITNGNAQNRNCVTFYYTRKLIK